MSDPRKQLLATAQAMSRAGLCPGTSGNVSVRAGDGFWITPSAVPYDTLTEADLVEMGLDGTLRGAAAEPSTEWRLHQGVLAARPEVGAVVHTHSMFAVALACARRSIPAFHYLVALAGGPDVRCAEYATYGTAELAERALAALDGRLACLLANHGLVAVGPDLPRALRVAETIELLAEQYWRALQVGPPVLLDDAEMARVAERLARYGQPRGRP